MSQRTATTTQLPKSRIRSARECQLIDAIEAYISRRGSYLEMASLGAERNDNPQFAKCRAAFEASEAALIPLLEGRLPVIYQGYCYACEGRVIRTREVQPL